MSEGFLKGVAGGVSGVSSAGSCDCVESCCCNDSRGWARDTADVCGADSGSWLAGACSERESGAPASGWRGASKGPSQPSCNPRIYSFHVWRPSTKSPCNPSHSRMPVLRRACSSKSSSSLLSAPESSCDLSPFRFRSFLILSARPALTSPSRRPSITSQSRAPATSMGLMYSWKCSRATREPSPGGADRKTVILRGMMLLGTVSKAIWDTALHHLCWAFFL